MKTPHFKTTVFAALLLCGWLPTTALLADDRPGWTEDQPKALERAKTEKKLVLMDFTGSDWCAACKIIDKEVFSTPEFKEFAKDHLVLLELDYPQETPQDPATRKQNQALAQKYGVEGFPTLIVLDADGKPLKAWEGYHPGGAKELLEQLKQLKG